MYREVALVPSENLQRAKEVYAKAAFTEVHSIPYGEFHLLSLYAQTLNKVIAARQLLADKGVAMNAVTANDNSRTTNLARWHYSCRYDSTGEMLRDFNYPVDELTQTTFEHLKSHLWPDGVTGNLAELRAYCISQQANWDYQVQNGQLYTMMKLLGAEE